MKYLSYFFQGLFTLHFIFLVLDYYISFLSISLVYFAPLFLSVSVVTNLCLESFILNFLIGQHLYSSNRWLRASWAMKAVFVCVCVCVGGRCSGSGGWVSRGQTAGQSSAGGQVRREGWRGCRAGALALLTDWRSLCLKPQLVGGRRGLQHSGMLWRGGPCEPWCRQPTPTQRPQVLAYGPTFLAFLSC